jgi:P-type Cu+ transporter
MHTAEHCAHCGLDCGAFTVESEGQPFCCMGCKTVFGILHKAGLGSFYAVVPRAGVRPDEQNQAFAFLDETSIRESILDFSDGHTARVTFRIPAIHCMACIWLLERLHKLHEGIGRSEADFMRREVSIVFDEEQLTLSELASLLDQLGYTPDLKLDRVDAAQKDPLRRSMFLKIGLAGFCFGNVMLMSFPAYLGLESTDLFAAWFGVLSLLFALPAVVYSAQDYWSSAWRGICQKRLTIDVPIALGMLALLAQSLYDIATRSGEGYLDSLTGLIFFLLIGKWFQQRQYDALRFDRDFKSYFPLSTHRITEAGEESVAIHQLEPGDFIQVRDGELIPADSLIRRGDAQIDYSFVTGESDPQPFAPGDRIYAGGRQVGGVLELEVIKPVSSSYLTSLWNDGIFAKGAEQGFDTITDLVGRYFTITVLFIAVATGLSWWGSDHGTAVRAFAAVLIVACPCALALSAPFAFGNVMRIFGRHGCYLKNALVVERIARINHLVFDKTGTLTSGGHAVETLEGALSPDDEAAVRGVLQASTHPLSRSLFLHLNAHPITPTQFEQQVGKGLMGRVGNQDIRIGRYSWLRPDEIQREGVWIEIDGQLKAGYLFRPEIRKGMLKLLNKLQHAYPVSILSGDSTRNVRAFADTVETAHWLSEQNPHAKLETIRALQVEGARVAMLGDGLNDAGALKQSDVGIAVTEDIHAFSPACDAMLDAGSLDQFDRILRAARASVTVVMFSIGLSLLYNIGGIAWAASGRLSPLFAALLMPLSSITVVGFALAATTWVARRNQLGGAR